MSIPAPAKVPPIVVGHIQYGDSAGFNNNVLRIFDTRTGKEIRQVDLYRYPLVPRLETDVQTVFFKSMTLDSDGKDILIENTRGQRFRFNLQDQSSRELNHLCSLKLVEAVQVGNGWSVRVELSTTNVRPGEDFYLDRLSFGDTYQLRNNLFEVISATGELAYGGAMAKRAPPEGVELLDIHRQPGRSRTVAVPAEFALLEPGQSHTVTIELGRNYAFPPEGGTFRIRYRHRNHFSPNRVDLESNVIRLELTPGQSTPGKPKPPVP